jgi:hypothetical protein
VTAWDISPSGVKGVLTNTATAAEGLSNTGKALEKTVPSAAKSAGTIEKGGVEKSGTQGPVAAALGEFFNAYQKDLMYVAERTSVRFLPARVRAQGRCDRARSGRHHAPLRRDTALRLPTQGRRQHRGDKSATKKAATQLKGGTADAKIAILDVHQSIADLSAKMFKEAEFQARRAGATFHLRFIDGSVTVPPNGPVFP